MDFKKKIFQKEIVLPISLIKLEEYKYFSSGNQERNSNFCIRTQDMT